MIKILEEQLLALRPGAQADHRASLIEPFAREMRQMPGAAALVDSPLLEARIARALEAANRFDIFDPRAAFLFCYAHVETGCAFWEHEVLRPHLDDRLVHPLAKARHAYLLRHAVQREES